VDNRLFLCFYSGFTKIWVIFKVLSPIEVHL
jgi:hypothetical protein